MDDLDVLARDFGLGSRGKSNPMRSDSGDRRYSSARSASPSSSLYDDHSNRDGVLFNDVFGGPPKYTSTTTSINNKSSSSVNDFDYDSIFKSSSAVRESKGSKDDTGKTSSLPVYDKPVYDDDIFDGLPGLKSKSPVSAGRFDDDMFAYMATPPKQRNDNTTADQFDDLLGNLANNHKSNNKNTNSEAFGDLFANLGKKESVMDGSRSTKSSSSKGLDDLLGAFGSSSPAGGNRSASYSNHVHKPAGNASQSSSNIKGDPFVVLESPSPQVSSSEAGQTDPLEEIDKHVKIRNTKTDSPSVSGGVFEDIDPLHSFRKSAVPSPDLSNRGNGISTSSSGPSISGSQAPASSEYVGKSSFKYSESHTQAKMQDENFQESPVFHIPATDSQRSVHRSAFSYPHTSANNKETNFHDGMSPGSEEHLQPSDDAWLTVSEIPLFTQPTRAPPPSRPPPLIPRKIPMSESSFAPSHLRRGDGFASPPGYTSYSQIPKTVRSTANSTSVSQIDELEDFVMGSTKRIVEEDSTPFEEEMNASSVAAAAMKEAMDKAEAKFRHAKEVREREYAKAAKSKEAVHVDQSEDALPDAEEREFQENQERFERERRRREEEEREQRRLEKERERAREIEREKARQAVERATREARERAVAEARVRAERAAAGKVQNEARERAEKAAVGKVQNEVRERAERAAVGKVQNEVRERAEKTAVHRAQAEVRERAAAEARERQEKGAAEAREREAREKAAFEARRRAERAAVERAAAEARERAAAESRERAAAAARANQRTNDNDVESFFNMNSQASSVPRARDNSSDSISDPPPFRGPGGPQGPNNTKAFSTTSIDDDLSSLFGGSQPVEFQEVEGESEERRKAKQERHHRTQERAAKALDEKNQRDLKAQREQEERHRISETLDLEIKRWAAGKEGNLRALLSTMQYVLWPECGWQPVSLTDLIVGASVKKVYRKATLCIHPDKVQQKGATLQQKYIAEKVFDLLKEAWNKFNSEELF